MKKFNRAISLLLCIVMVCCLLPVVQVSAAVNLPTGLTWGTSYWEDEQGVESVVEMPGVISWQSNADADHYVQVFKEGESEPRAWYTVSGYGVHQIVNFCLTDPESGNYYFTVTPRDTDGKYYYENTVTSAFWYYSKPSAKREAPSNPYWEWPVAKYTPAGAYDGRSGYELEIYYAEKQGDTPTLYDYDYDYSTKVYNGVNFSSYNFDRGYYYFRVRTLSTDLERICNSDWSVMSAPYYFGNPFVDVNINEYYGEPVLWAVEEGITTGLDTTHFGPDATCTRGQIVTFLWRAFGCPEPTSSNNPFYDVSSSDYFYKAVLWAVENGITSGMSANSFAPNAPCTRGQVATFLWRAKGQPSANAANSFNDVASGAYYYNPVLWAVANGVTNGMGDGSFAPDAPCTRGQIVTFLYRAMA